ncbi:TetR/AcrR family transcriptional regulator [Azospirillum sp. ST 5-10]|uniref:TetR/AcrR family transcriptional regulator n=1 Tax=unclassified Azospirillum TaxID=2630922 RepID=UPI003F4A21DE
MSERNASHTILDAAERIFALHGFDGTSMRQIAAEAGVAQALLHYHFGSKEKLFEAMFARRSDAINAERAVRLERLFGPDGAGRPSLEDLLEALFRPTMEFGHGGQPGNLFSRILVATANADDERSRQLIGDHYDAIARRFIEAFRQVEPALRPDDAVWAYLFAIGVGMTMMAATGRAGRLSEGACDDADVDAVMARIVPFISGGVRALAAGPGTP